MEVGVVGPETRGEKVRVAHVGGLENVLQQGLDAVSVFAVLGGDAEHALGSKDDSLGAVGASPATPGNELGAKEDVVALA
mmetsp:Transcript_4881/g.8573  ORF Transcript_4881/g.8573 Transcript_4881/m.8573 type:complete len:80 (-) Transcript_4881:519-758(-)